VATSYTQNKETSKKTRTNYEHDQYVMCVWGPVKEEVAKETENVLKRNRFAILASEFGDRQGFTRRA
jgi:hypothetical protein